MRARLIIGCVVAMVLLQTAKVLAIGRDPFNGIWEVTLTPDEGAQKEIKDKLTFKGSQFTSEYFAKKGFNSSPYEEDTRGAVAATFKAKVKSETKAQGTTDWSGTSTGVDITGELTWTKGDGTEVKYTFKGTRKS